MGLSWLLDPYGARRQQGKAARARIEVADAEADAAQLLVLLNLSNAYIDLRYSQQVLRIRHQEIRSRRQTLELTQTLFDKSSATRLDLVRAEARLSEAEAAVPTRPRRHPAPAIPDCRAFGALPRARWTSALTTG